MTTRPLPKSPATPSGEAPMLLMPLRLETAFAGTSNAPLLRVRIVPDEMQLASDAQLGASTDLLPERFTVRVRVGDRMIRADTSELVDVLDIAPDSPWLVNFDEAVRSGLGVEVALPPNTDSIDEVVVVGVSQARPSQAAERLRRHLTQLARRNGFEFVARGTPTNNTAGARAGSRQGDVPVAAGGSSCGAALARAFGLPEGSLDGIVGAAEQAPPDDLPSVRIGRQVYGVLIAPGDQRGGQTKVDRPTRPGVPIVQPLDDLRRSQPTGIRLGAWGVTLGFTRRDASSTPAEFVLSPSPHHAVTAAVLRSATRQGADERFSIGLSGERGRGAVQLAAALRTGRSLGDVLGARIEGALLEAARTDPTVLALLAALQERFPLRGGRSRSRCDGLRLAELYGERGAGVRSPLHKAIRPQHSDSANEALAAVMNGIVDGVDALADLALAESVHQFVAGRYERAGSAADLLTGDDVDTGGVPDRFEVLAGESSGTPVTQRVVLALPAHGNADRPPGWSKTTPRARLAPNIDAALASALGDPGQLRLSAIDSSGEPVADCTVADLGLAALDLGALENDTLADLITVADSAESDRDRVTGVVGADAGSVDAIETARAWHAALAATRPLAPSDLLGEPSEPRLEGVPGTAEVVGEFRALASRMNPTAEDLCGFGLGISGGHTAIGTRLPEVERLIGVDPIAGLRACFGGQVVLEGHAEAALPEAAVSSAPVDRWLADVARVRPGISSYLSARIDTGGARAMQTPAAPYRTSTTGPAEWVGGAFTGTLAGPVTSTLLLGHDPSAPKSIGPVRAYAGVVVDEWVEMVPTSTAVGAVSLHLSSPNSRAPQAAILAVPPTGSGWSEDALFTVIDLVMSQVSTRAASEGDPEADLDELLAARVRDPLWFLVRQQQLGELAGEDAGWPVSVEVETERASLSRWNVTSTASGWSPSLLKHVAAITAGPGWAIDIESDAADGADSHTYALHAVESKGTKAARTKAGRTTSSSMVPAPVRFAGMPADRYWEMEDPRLSLAVVELGESDDDLAIGRLALIEFATMFGNDWFTVPVTLARGGITTIKGIVVTDSFGRAEHLEAVTDEWHLFGPSSDVVLVPPPSSSSIVAGPIEDSLALVVDEGANLVWGISGSVLEQATTGSPDVGSRGSGNVETFTVSSTLPGAWHPFVPDEDGTMLQSGVPDENQSQLLLECAESGVARSALGATGSTVRLRSLMARGPNGERWVWRGHSVEHVVPPIRLATSFDTLQ